MLNFQIFPARTPLFPRPTAPLQSAMFRVAAVAVALCGFFAPEGAAQSPQTFDTSGTFVVPAGVEFITVEAWGGGGGGGGGAAGAHGGGGGGAYATRRFSVTAGQTYTVTVGAGGGVGTNRVAGTAGGGSTITLEGDVTVLVRAAGGATGALAAGGSGGTSAGSVGTTIFAGGNGAAPVSNTGGGGGGSATTTTVGGNASGVTGGTGTGNGGTGGGTLAGSAPGGGGAGKANGANDSGAGAAGRIVITYTVPTPASFGGIPASQNYTEGVTGKLLLAPSATLTDSDSTDFGGGYLRAAFTANGEATEDRIYVREINNITLVNNLSITNGTYSGSIEVRHSGTLIGTITAANRGSGGSPLQIDLNASATVARTQDLLRSIFYENIDGENAIASTRTIQITVRDGEGGTATADTNIVVAAEAFSITSPSSGWTRLLNSTSFDPSEDQQAASGPDLVGTLGTPLLYAKYDDKGTSATSDDTVAFRLRVDDSTNSAGLYNGYIFIGYDFEMDGDIDVFISMEGTTKGTKAYVYPASGANTSPSTTGLGSRQIIPNYNTLTMSNYSTVQAIELTTQALANTYPGADADPDYFQTFQINYADLAQVLNGIAINNFVNAGNGYTTIGNLLVAGDPRNGFTEKTPFRFVIATSTQANAINSDFGGVPRLSRTSSALSWEALGAFSPEVTFGNADPSFTSGSGESDFYTVPEGTTEVATITATDGNGDPLVFGIRTGPGFGADGSLFRIDPETGVLSFVTAPDYEAPADAGADNRYEVTVEVSDGKGGVTTQLIVIYVTDINEGVNSRPAITSNGADVTASVSIPENTAAVTTVTSVDDADFSGTVIPATATNSIVAGNDAAKFNIDPTTGVLTFVTPPDYENPTDTNGDNTYIVTVRVTDGGTPVFSDDQIITVTILDVDEPVAPVLAAAAPALPTLTEDETGDGGRTISQVLGASATDTIGAVIGIAVTAINATNGVWEYSLDGGSNWIPVGSTVEYRLAEDDAGVITTEAIFTSAGAISDANALLLRAEDLIRFKPNAENGGGGSFTYRAWDESSGFAGQYVSTSINGDATAFSSSTDTASITTTDVNDAPTVSGGPVTLTTIYDYQTSASTTVASLISGITYGDVDTGHVSGVAVTGASGAGEWQYSVDGTTWGSIGAISNSSALLLPSTYRVRYIPAYVGPVGGENATLTLRGWDQTGSTSSGAGTKVSAATTGGTTPFSISTFTVEIAIQEDDRSVTVTSITVNEASRYAFFTVAGGALQEVTLSLNAGTATAGSGNDYLDSTIEFSYNGITWSIVPNRSPLILSGTDGTILIRVPLIYNSTDEPDETFTLTASNVGGADFTGTATIVDDGNGTLYNEDGTTDNSTVKADDRAVSVTGGIVNEASTWTVFNVTGTAGQLVSLSLVEGSGAGFADLDQTQSLEWWDPSANAGAGAWVSYSSYATVPLGGTLLVRVNITQERDSVSEGPETFQLSAANLSGVSASATMTIVDDGSGVIFPDAPPVDPSTPATSSTGLDDDRAMTLTSVTVNEASPWAVFTLTGIEGQTAVLSLVNNADGTDLVTIEYFDGSVWRPYSGSLTLPLNGPANGETASILVRVGIAPEQESVTDGPETFTLVASTISNLPSTGGVGTITDDGTGSVFLDTNNTATPNDPSAPGYTGPALDDDRAVSVTGGTVNEASPWAVFSVTGAAGQLVTLSLVEGSGAGFADLDQTQNLEWWDPSANAGAGAWVPYSSYATVPAGGTLLVRVNITQERDSASEGPETFQLSAANLSGVSASATMTINDDGSGAVYPDSPPVDPSTPASSSTGLDDDRAMSLTNVTVNEASPWAVFTLTGIEGQTAILSLVNNDDGADLVTIEYFDGSVWRAYTGPITLPLNGPANGETASILVRVGIAPEQDSATDGPETFTLVASTVSGLPSTGGVGTITDDGTGSVFLDTNNTATPNNPSAPGYTGPALDDDRPTPGIPEINLRGSGISIRSGKTVIDAYDSTDFGIAKAGVGGNSVTRTFSIENVGTGDLTFPGDPVVSVTGANASDFSITQPSSSNIAASGARSFTITFTPGAVGIRSATVSIPNNDSNENPYTFAIGGEGKTNLAPIDLNFTGGRLEDGIDADEAAPAASGFFTGTPDLGVDNTAAVYNTFTLVAGAGDSDNNKFAIVGNQLSLRQGEDTHGIGARKRTSHSRRPAYDIRVQVSDHEGNTFEKAFKVVVMVIRSDEGDFFIADRGPYVSTGTVLLVSKQGFIQRIFSTTIADPYEITVDGNGDMIISNHEHDLSNVTALDNSGIYKIDRLSGVQTKIVGGTTSGSVMPFVTPLGVKVETSGTYIVGDPDAFNFTGAVFRVDPSASPVTITELTRGGNLDYLQGVGLAPNGDIYVSNVITPVGSPSQILKIDPVSGAQTVFASAGNLIYPTGLAVEEDGSAVVVVDALTKKVVSIAIPGGTQTVISSDAQFIQPTHIAIEKTGDYLVTDGKSSSFTRRLFRVDKGTGKATEVSINGSFEQPRGVSTAK